MNPVRRAVTDPIRAEILSCKSKRQYPSQVDALLDAAERDRTNVRSYRCKVCRFWHYTSKRSS